MKRIFWVLTAVFIVMSCTDNGEIAKAKKTDFLPDSVLTKRWQAIKILKDSIREGDLVLRCGNDHISESLRDFSQQEKLYSHSGIALTHNGEMFIYSNMAGDINPNEIMRRDNVDSFLSPVHNLAAGVYRYDFSKEESAKLKSIVEAHYINRLPFDMNFDLATDHKMYCAEMIAKSVERATANRILIQKSPVTKELRQKYLKMALNKKVVPSVKSGNARKEYWSIDNLYLNPHCREVKRTIFGDPQQLIRFPTPENYTH
ncbi:MAG TPA: YiiX/YebB-like N1pC/P60 family cysteine hydrolase [Chitinophagaceae bacterium]|nr:YiiX/YebB-like N1pC/P60 family cysteine hydrolase [Chitinophagaceae bacterium]